MKNRKKGRFLTLRNLRRKNNSRARGFISYQYSDLSDIEEIKDRAFFEKIGKDAAANAVNENKAMHIPITFLQDDWIVRRMPSGMIEKIHQLKKDSGSYKNRKLTKGSVLHVKKATN